MEEELKGEMLQIMYDRSLNGCEKVDKIITFIREAGYMTTEMVKGLMLEAQAQKCAKCPKNIIYAPVECNHDWAYFYADAKYRCIKCGLNKEPQ